MSLVTIATYSKPEEAHILRLRLGAGDVEAFVQDENTIQVDWFLSNAIGGVRVQIDDGDMERAREILRDHSDVKLEDDWPTCPFCSSTHTAPDEFLRRLSFLFVWLASFPLPFARNAWKCVDCGKAWKERPAGPPENPQ